MTDIEKEKITRTVCRFEDGTNCGLLAHVKDGVLVKVEPADFPTPGLRHICSRGLCSVNLVYDPNRIKHPLKRVGERGEGKWERISWDEALDIIVTKLKEISNRYGSEAVGFVPGQIHTSALAHIYMRLANALQATCISLLGYGDSAGPTGDLISYGFPLGNHYTRDIDDPKMIAIWGANYVETWPLFWRLIRNEMEKGAKVVVIDPRFTSTASKADEYISIRPGTDTALALGMMKVIIEKNLVDKSFMTQHTVGPFLVRGDNGKFLREKDISSGGSDKYVVWDAERECPKPYDEIEGTPALKGVFGVKGFECRPAFQILADLVKQYPLNRVAEITEIPAETVERLAIDYASLKPAASYRGWGLQRTFHGHLTWRAITTLAALTGNVKLEGVREFKLNFEDVDKVKNQSCRQIPLLKMYEEVLEEKPQAIKSLWISAYNFADQSPNFNQVVKELFPRLEFIVVADLFMNTSAQYADIVLPACSFYEKADLIPAPETKYPHLQLLQKVIEPLHESKSDVDIVNELGSKMGFSEYFGGTPEEYIELLLSSGHPSIEGVTLAGLKEQPATMPLYETPVFTTPSGRIEFYSEAMKEFGEELPLYIEPLEGKHRPLAKKYPLAFIQGHTKYSYCSSLFNDPWLREIDPEPMLEMHPADAQKRDIHDGSTVVVFNDRGKLKLKTKLNQGVKPGVIQINHGWWPRHFAEGTPQALTHSVINQVQAAVLEPNAAFNDNLVEVKKEDE